MSTTPTASELAILNQLWTDGPLTVRDIHERLSDEKEVVYTTVLKTMQNMYESGLLDRERRGRQHVYRAVIERGKTQDRLLDRFLNRAFGGSATGLVMRALGNYRPKKDDIQELKALIERLEIEEE